MSDRKDGLFRRFYRSFVLSESQEKRKSAARNFIYHLHPVNVPKSTLKFTHTFGLGGMSALLIVMLAVSGILLRFFYQPFPAYAYESVLDIQNHILFGGFLRNIHYWSATFLLIIAVLHLLRVFFTRAFLPPRQFNWVIGLLLLFLVMLSNYTGYLLPWDQLSYWAITVSTNMLGYIPFIGGALMHLLRGGSEVGAQTLLIYYNLHTGVIPLFIVLLMGWHFWRVRKAGGVILPGGIGEDEKNETAPVILDLIYKEFVVALALIAVVFFTALIFDAPLMEKANPALSPDPVKAPWYFVGIQELLLHFDPLFSVLIIPLTALITLFLIPYYNYKGENPGIWFVSPNGKKLALLSGAVSFLFTLSSVIISEYWLHFDRWFPALPLWLSNGLFPFILLTAVIAGVYYWLKGKSTSADELIQAVFIFFLTGLIVLTVTALWFRGAGMALAFPL